MEKFLKQLYIPHGSDETEGEKISDLKLIQLYIPHGSDETCLKLI